MPTSGQAVPRLGIINSPGAIVVDGDNHGIVTSLTFSGAFDRLSDSILSLTDAADRGAVRNFTGRHELIADIDTFVGSAASGCFLLVAPAGWGKSTFLAALAESRHYQHHFVRYPGPAALRIAQKNLAAQLIERWHLEECAPGGVLPAAANEKGWLRRVVSLAAERRDEAFESDPIVLVIDDASRGFRRHPRLR